MCLIGIPLYTSNPQTRSSIRKDAKGNARHKRAITKYSLRSLFFKFDNPEMTLITKNTAKVSDESFTDFSFGISVVKLYIRPKAK